MSQLKSEILREKLRNERDERPESDEHDSRAYALPCSHPSQATEIAGSNERFDPDFETEIDHGITPEEFGSLKF